MNIPKLISSTFEINGELQTIYADENTAPEAVDQSLYADDGWTIEMSYGCVGNKVIDEHISNMLVGDKYQQAIAEEAATKFAVILPDRNYDPEVKTNLVRNYQQGNDTFVSGWLGMFMFEPFHSEMDRDASGQVHGVGEPIAGYTVPIFGFNPNATHSKVPAEYISYLNRAAASKRTAAENPNVPKPIPNYPR